MKQFISALLLGVGLFVGLTQAPSPANAACPAGSTCEELQGTAGQVTISGGGGAPLIAGLADTAVTPSTYGSGTLIPVVTVDAKGRITNVTVTAVAGSGGAFSALTGGTNTTAAMLVGTGASLAATGTGTIDATTLLTKTWAAPAAIGTGTPAAGNFTALSATGSILFSGLITGTQVSCMGLDAGNNVVLASSACGSGGGLTSVTLAPGNTTVVGTQNTGSDTITTTGTISPQNWPVSVGSSCTVNVNCNGGVTNETGEVLKCTANVTTTLPNPAAGTKGNTYMLAGDGTHQCTLATVGGTATFYNAPGSGSTTYAVPVGAFAAVFDDGANYLTFVGATGSGITTLTGDVTAGPGSGSQATTIANNAVTTAKINNAAVTLAKIANAAANSKLVGSGAAGSGSAYSELTLGTNLSMSGTTLNATGGSGVGITGAGAVASQTQNLTRTYYPTGFSPTAQTSVNLLSELVLPASATAANLHCKVTSAPTGVQTVTYSLIDETTSTTLSTCTITGASVDGVSSGSGTVAAQDVITMQVVTSATAASTGVHAWSWTWQ